MKKTLYIAAAAFSLLAVSCAKELEGNKISGGIIAHASLQPVEATKAVGQYSYNIVWETNDKIAVLDNANNKASFSLKEGVGSTTGTFKQDGTDDLTAPLTAYYPASVVTDGNALVWPATQTDVKNITNVPMTASSSAATGNVNFAFKHLGAVLQLVLTAKDGEINVKQIDITADQGLSGAFTVTDGQAVITNSGTSITTEDISSQKIKLNAKATYLNFAVPAGDFTNYRIIVTDTDNNTYSLTAPSLSIQKAMVNKLPAALNAGVLFVNGHKVKVKLADDVVPHDIMTESYVDGNNVIINATSLHSKALLCNVGDNAKCERTVTNGIFTFTISEISSNIEAILGYVPIYYTLTVRSDSNGKVWIGDDETKTSGQFEAGQQVVIHATANENFRLFRWNDNNRETSRTITIGETDAIYSALFISADAIPSLYTVNSEGKQVFFSKGNLWCDGTGDGYSDASPKIKSWGFESNQYDSTPSSKGNRSISHISHFLWCADESNAVCEKYNNDWNVNGVFLFTNADATTPNPDFAVNGLKGYWRVLSGDTGGEWEYLLDKRETTYGKETTIENRRYAAVKVNGIAGLLIFPDDFSSWPTKAGTEPETFNTNSSNWNNRNYSLSEFEVLEAAGCVFLPAAGYRYGDSDSDVPANVLGVGSYGYYWSASPNGSDYAFYLSFSSDRVNPSDYDYRSSASSVRLVTEYQSEPSAE